MPEATRSESLSIRYARHNRGRGRGFIYGGGERVDALRSAMGASVRGRVLDLGCRDGSLARALDLSRAATVGADIDPQALAIADADHVLHACRADLWGPFPFRDGAFDLVVAGEIVEHVPFPSDLVGEVARVLRPRGRFVGSVPNTFRLKNRLTFLSGRWFEADPTHLRQFSQDMLRELLSAHFTSIDIRPCVGRWVEVWPNMLANDLVWKGVKR